MLSFLRTCERFRMFYKTLNIPPHSAEEIPDSGVYTFADPYIRRSLHVGRQSRGPFGSHVRTNWPSFWDHLAGILGLSGRHFGIIWQSVGIIWQSSLVAFCVFFGDTARGFIFCGRSCGWPWCVCVA